MYIKIRVYEEEGELRGSVQAKALGPLQSSHLEWASPTWTSSPNDAWTQVISKRPYSFPGNIRGPPPNGTNVYGVGSLPYKPWWIELFGVWEVFKLCLVPRSTKKIKK